MKLIDKDALVTEIENRMQEHHSGYLVCLKDILSFINTIEVTEIDLQKELGNYIEHYRNRETGYSMLGIAKHFFELGLKAQKGE